MAKKGSGPPKLAKALLHQALAKVINRTSGTKVPLGTTYYVTSPVEGIFRPLVAAQTDPDVVRYVPQSSVAADILRYCGKELASNDQYQLTAREADAVVAYWLYDTAAVPEPKPFSWPGETGLTFTRLPWHPHTGTMPTWDRILSRVSNCEAFLAWVGSLFDESSYLQQYVWMYGDGLRGKGCINRFLEKVFGPAYASKQPREGGDKFWTHGLIGKRLVVFPDCDDVRFITSGLFKSMTGGDPVTVEAKGEMAYTARLKAKYLVLSNEKPNISSDFADNRRIIYCEVGAREDAAAAVGSGFEEELWEQGGAFLGRCAEAYRRHSAGPILADVIAIKEWVEDVEMPFEEVFDFYFTKDEKVGTPDEMKGLWCTPIALQRVLRQEYKQRKPQLEFLAWLAREKKIKKEAVWIDKDNNPFLYKGLLPKQAIHSKMVRNKN